MDRYTRILTILLILLAVVGHQPAGGFSAFEFDPLPHPACSTSNLKIVSATPVTLKT
jgi:hypothetical protein